MENNVFLDYYGEKHISPVRQNIDNISLHYQRRRKLHRQVGIPYLFFNNAQVLEVGPGSGYNSLWYISAGGQGFHIDLVEANPRGVEDMERLFQHENIGKEKYTIFQTKIEDYKTKKRYDFILAEGFLQYLDNQETVVNKLKSLAADHGVVMVTCSDDVCLYIELMKRLIGLIITKDINDYNLKVEYLLKMFGESLSFLNGASRLPVDYIRDNFLNPSYANGNELSLIQAIHLFGDEFDVLGTSPSMFVDYSWYKDIDFDYKKSYAVQYKEKNMSLLLANMDEIILQSEESDELGKLFRNIKKLENQYEHTYRDDYLEDILDEIKKLNRLFKGYNKELELIFTEIENALKNAMDKEIIDIKESLHFYKAFGRTQQYIAFEKK